MENIDDEQRTFLGEFVLINSFQFQSLFGAEKELTDKKKASCSE